jgi:hypothetical protein
MAELFGAQYIDTDGDGLQDMLEDQNQNVIVDEGETNPYVRDSDEDGIPDGKEDRNRNGLWDENETDPTCPDSDGDGIWDGADIYPTPTLGEQIITRINPAEAAAEGGSLVFIQGRNFTNDTQFWFGSRRSPSVRILSPEFAIVIVPEFHGIMVERSLFTQQNQVNKQNQDPENLSYILKGTRLK